MNTFAKIFIGTVAASAAVYVFETIRRQSDLIQNSDFRVHGAGVKMNGLTRATISAQLELKNKSDLQFTINSYDATIYLNGVQVGTAAASPKAVVEKNSTKDYPFAVDVDILTVFDQASTFTRISDVMGSDFRVEGSYFVNNSFFFARIPFDVSYKLRELI